MVHSELGSRISGWSRKGGRKSKVEGRKAKALNSSTFDSRPLDF
jgi:hypothetical protein